MSLPRANNSDLLIVRKVQTELNEIPAYLLIVIVVVVFFLNKEIVYNSVEKSVCS